MNSTISQNNAEQCNYAIYSWNILFWLLWSHKILNIFENLKHPLQPNFRKIILIVRNAYFLPELINQYFRDNQYIFEDQIIPHLFQENPKSKYSPASKGRSGHSQMFFKISNIYRKALLECWSFFLIKLRGWLKSG